MGRIAIMQYEWPLQSHTLNFVRALLERGHQVDLFSCRCPSQLVDCESLEARPAFRHIRIGSSVGDRWEKLRGIIYRTFRLTLGRVSFEPLLLPVLPVSLRYAREQRYDFAIGVEKSGAIWASLLHRLTGIPFVYFSLELYDEHHPYYFERAGFPAWRRAEARAHRRARATIIQDRQRGDHLCRANALDNGELIYFPVSVSGAPILQKATFFREQFDIPREKRILLYLGLIDEPRGCLDVSRRAGSLPRDISLVFHGYGDSGVVEMVLSAAGGALTLSLDLVTEHELPQVVSSADIGLALYRRDCANDLLTAYSSEKVALYCRAGIPFIAFESESYRDLKEKYDCCELIDSADNLNQAITKIVERYEYYRANALNAYASLYRYELNVGGVIDRLNGLFNLDKEMHCGAVKE